MRLRFRWYDCIFIILFTYLFILQIQAIWPFTIDDMYITLRYARNWINGDGLVWNNNAPPVEGYSNFSFVVFGALSLGISVDPVIALKCLGVAGLLFTCIFIFFISRFWFGCRESLIPPLLLLFYKGQIIWSVSGLETTFYEALLCGSVYSSFLGLGYNYVPKIRGNFRKGCFIISGLLLSIAGMTRPETPVFMVLFVCLFYWDSFPVVKKERLKGMGYFIAPILIIFLPYFLWRWHYFGYLFPNSVYCKGYASNSISIVDINYLK